MTGKGAERVGKRKRAEEKNRNGRKEEAQKRRTKNTREHVHVSDGMHAAQVIQCYLLFIQSSQTQNTCTY